MEDDTYADARYGTTMEGLKKREAAMPVTLYTALTTTATNAYYLFNITQNEGHPAYLHAALLLFDKVDEVVARWDEDPEFWFELERRVDDINNNQEGDSQ
jgi:hypothetical protein